VRFSIVDQKAEFDVFTTRPDTLWGVTYMVLAPEHALVEEVTSAGQRAAVETYIAETRKLSETERLSTVKEKNRGIYRCLCPQIRSMASNVPSGLPTMSSLRTVLVR
jgi:leucyl-tRNA synthetase